MLQNLIKKWMYHTAIRITTKRYEKIINPLKDKYLEIGFKSIQIYEFPMPLYQTGTYGHL